MPVFRISGISVLVFVSILTLTTSLASQATAPEPQAAVGQPAATEPKISSVAVYPQAATQNTSQGANQDFVLEIAGSGFASITDMNSVHIAVLPAAGVTPNPIPAVIALAGQLENTCPIHSPFELHTAGGGLIGWL